MQLLQRLKKWKNSGKVTALLVSPRSGESWGLLLCDTNMQLRHRKQLSGLMEELLMVAK
ncbi:hypothetical protein ABKV19_007974 [Rosa sericea]